MLRIHCDEVTTHRGRTLAPHDFTPVIRVDMPADTPIEDHIDELLSLPRGAQVDAARRLLAARTEPLPEAWNTAFGPRSLFDAWCATTVARRVHHGVREVVLPRLEPGFVLIEVGGGDGATWRDHLDVPGTLVVVDPVAEVHERVREAVPDQVEVVGVVASVQDVDLPDADALVCSLTLHHVAGRDERERAAHGLTGPGKREVLSAFGRCLARRGGVGVLVEADVDCEVDLPPGDPRLADHIFDSYVRRCARSIVADVRDRGPREDPDLVGRWRALLRHWFLGQLAVVDAPVAERDVYELTVPRWLELLDAAGLEVDTHGFVDDLPLFHRYVFRPTGSPRTGSGRTPA
jgi:hypothetical protein